MEVARSHEGRSLCPPLPTPDDLVKRYMELLVEVEKAKAALRDEKERLLRTTEQIDALLSQPTPTAELPVSVLA